MEDIQEKYIIKNEPVERKHTLNKETNWRVKRTRERARRTRLK